MLEQQEKQTKIELENLRKQLEREDDVPDGLTNRDHESRNSSSKINNVNSSPLNITQEPGLSKLCTKWRNTLRKGPLFNVWQEHRIRYQILGNHSHSSASHSPPQPLTPPSPPTPLSPFFYHIYHKPSPPPHSLPLLPLLLS